MVNFRRATILSLAILFAGTTLHAQGIRGVVRTNDGRPLAGVEVRAGETAQVSRTDSAGRYALPRVAAGQTTLRARLISYSVVDTVVSVPSTGWVDVDVVMVRIAPLLAEVRAHGMQNQCDPNTVDGFRCRMQAGVGYYRGEQQLRAMKSKHFAGLFEGFPGIRLSPSRTPSGFTLLPGVRPSRCLVTLVNGRPPFTPITDWYPEDVIGVEYYDEYRKVPEPFRVYIRAGFCDMVVYWLSNAREGEPAPTIAQQLALRGPRASSELYDAIVRVLRRAPARGETRFIPEGYRIAMDLTGLDTALSTLGLERAPNLDAFERRYPDMRFQSARQTLVCGVGANASQCSLPARVSSVQFEEPSSPASNVFAFRMIVSERAEQRNTVTTRRTMYDMAIEYRDGVWMLMQADVVSVP